MVDHCFSTLSNSAFQILIAKLFNNYDLSRLICPPPLGQFNLYIELLKVVTYRGIRLAKFDEDISHCVKIWVLFCFFCFFLFSQITHWNFGFKIVVKMLQSVDNILRCYIQIKCDKCYSPVVRLGFRYQAKIGIFLRNGSERVIILRCTVLVQRQNHYDTILTQWQIERHLRIVFDVLL